MKKHTGLVVSVTSLGLSVGIYVALFLGASLYQYLVETSEIDLRIVAGAICLAHFVLSATIINERQRGAMFTLGLPICDLESGPYFAFFPLFYIRTATRNIVQIEIGVLTPEEREKAKTLESSASVFLFEEPLHINWADLKSAHYDSSEQKKAEIERFKNNPLAEALVTATHLTVRFEIFSYIAVVRKAGSLPEAIALIQKAATSALITYAGKSFVARAIANMEDVDEWLKKRVEDFVADPGSDRYKEDPTRSWGVNIRKTQITRMGTAKRLSEAQADKGKVIYAAHAERFRLEEVAAGEAEATRIKALSERIKLAQEGAGRADAERLLLFARQEGFAKLAELAGTTVGQFVLQLEVLEKGLSAGKAIVLPMELSRIVNVLSEKFTPSSLTPLK